MHPPADKTWSTFTERSPNAKEFKGEIDTAESDKDQPQKNLQQKKDYSQQMKVKQADDYLGKEKKEKKKKPLKDEEIKHNWPTIDRQPKVSHVEPKFKAASSGAEGEDIQVDISSVEVKELPKKKEIVKDELTGGAL